MTAPRRRLPRSGRFLVIALVLVCATLAGLTWIRYRDENPTSLTATLTRHGERWSVAAQFDPAHAAQISPGTRAVVTTPVLAGEALAGSVLSITPDGAAIIAITHGPRATPAFDNALCNVTLDSATAP
jgi:hypothetical protein